MKVWRYLFGSSKTKIEKAIDKILNDDEFKSYQGSFALLVPSREVIIEDGELVITTSDHYSFFRYSIDWEDPDVKDRVFEILDREYSVYAKQNIYNIQNDILKIDHPAIEFVEMSLKDENVEWNEWVDKYFHPESPGYELFKEMNNDIPVKYNSKSPQLIWCIMLQNMEYLGTLYAQRPTVYDFPNTVEIVDQDGMSWAYVSYIEGKWYYMAITTSCLEYVWALYEKA